MGGWTEGPPAVPCTLSFLRFLRVACTLALQLASSQPSHVRTLLPPVDRNYYQCWVGLQSHFDPAWTPEKAAAASGSSGPPPPQQQQQRNGAVLAEA